MADILSVAGINRLITMDLHADQIQGFFDVPVDHLYASSVFIPYIQSLKLKDMVVATPDVGGSKRASTYAKYLGVPLVLCHKQRAKANVVESMTVIGDVEGKNVILVDDMVDTAGTITKAADIMTIFYLFSNIPFLKILRCVIMLYFALYISRSTIASAIFLCCMIVSSLYLSLVTPILS